MTDDNELEDVESFLEDHRPIDILDVLITGLSHFFEIFLVHLLCVASSDWFLVLFIGCQREFVV